MNALQLFNPSNQSAQEITKNFSIRKKEFTRISKIIGKDKMQNAPQHFIIQGVRGSGKTTLLLRLYYEIKNNTAQSKWLLPLIFNEEQYNLNKLFKFWEQIAVELESESNNYVGLVDEMQDTKEIENYDERCYDILFAALKKNENKICVLWDNIGDLLQKLSKKEKQRLREVLIINNQIRIIGASSEVLEATYNYDEPFYEYFKIIHLQELKNKETQEFLLTLDEINGTNKIQGIIDENPGKIEALRIITGGIPRTIVLLYEIFVNDDNGDSFKYLEILLDRVTPLYKHRMDVLSSQQQEIIDCIALNWDAMPVKEVARITRMESKAVSSQLRLLEKNNVVIKKVTSTKNHLYQVKERFFNIWYIMRNGRKQDKNKVKWLTRFLELWCDKNSLSEMVSSHITKLESGKIYDKYAYNLSEAFAQLIPSIEMQHQLLDATKSYLQLSGSDLQDDVSDSDNDFINKEIIPLTSNEQYEQAIFILKKRASNTGFLELHIAIIYSEFLNNKNEAKSYYLKAISKGDITSMNNLAIMYSADFYDNKNAEKYFLLAVEKGDADAIFNLAILYDRELLEPEKAEKYYLLAVEKGVVVALNNLARLYQFKLRKPDLAEKYFLLSIDNGRTIALYEIAFLYQEEFKAYENAEKYYLKSIESGNVEAIASLALFYQVTVKKLKKAIKFYLMAIEKGHVGAMVNLGVLYANEYKDFESAKKYYLMAIEKGDGMAANNLGTLFHGELSNYKQAEHYYKIAIENKSEKAMNNLAFLYFEQGLQKSSAEILAAKAFSVNKEYNINHTYSMVLLWNNKIDEALKIISPLFENEVVLNKPIKDFELLISMLIAKKQYNYVYQIFEKNNNQIKDRLKPIYFALMHFMKDVYPDEIKKMGEELNETVDSIVQFILELREKYK